MKFVQLLGVSSKPGRFMVHDKRVIQSALNWRDITVGLGLQFPPSKIPQQVVWSVLNERQKEALVVDA